ncbi:cohesin domain-containing protein [Acholeplasma hippikon]|uniref:cohesin domain-containing protein n=1 Tax=Acholeplasma hippikon TaxID=264636 RepID=UPI00138DD197|nr:cohesin domain-containing protein [Acholeplasma hippikon]
MNKYIKVLFFAFICILLAPNISALEDNSKINVSDYQFYQSTYSTIYISSELKDISALELEIYYDSSIMEIQSTWSNLSNYTTNINVEGQIKFAFLASEGISGYQDLLMINIRIKDGAALGSYPFSVYVGDAYHSDLSKAFVEGKTSRISIIEYVSQPGSIYFYGGISRNPIPYEEEFYITLYTSNAYNLATGTFNIFYNEENLELLEIELTENFGNDVIKTINHNKGFSSISFVDADGINYYSQILIVRFKNISTRPVSDSIRIEPKNLYNADLQKLNASSQSWNLNLSGEPQQIKNKIMMNSVSGTTDDEIKVKVSISENTMLAAGDFVISYDKDIFKVKGIQVSEDIEKTKSILETHVEIDKGTVKFSFINMEGLIEAIDLLEIEFEIIRNDNDINSTISISTSGTVDKTFNHISFNYENSTISLDKYYLVRYFDYLGNIVSEQRIRRGNDGIEPEAIERAHYYFTGYSKSRYYVLNDMDIYPVYQAIAYRITYDTYVRNALYYYTIETGMYVLPELEWDGVTYLGWKYNNEIYKEINLSEILSDIYLEVVYVQGENTLVQFSTDDIESETVTYIGVDGKSNFKDGKFIVQFDRFKLNVKEMKATEEALNAGFEVTFEKYNYNGEIIFTVTGVKGITEDIYLATIIFEAVNTEDNILIYLSVTPTQVKDHKGNKIGLQAFYTSFDLGKYYTVTYYDFYGHKIYEEQVKKYNYISIPTPEDIPGYNFVGYSKEYIPVVEDMDIYPIYEARRYSIGYSDYLPGALYEYTIETGNYVLPSVDWERYDYIGWRYNGEIYREINLSEILDYIYFELVMMPSQTIVLDVNAFDPMENITVTIGANKASLLKEATYEVRFDSKVLTFNKIKLTDTANNLNYELFAIELLENGILTFKVRGEEVSDVDINLVEITFMSNEPNPLTSYIVVSASQVYNSSGNRIKQLSKTQIFSTYPFYTVRYFDYEGNVISEQRIKEYNHATEPEIPQRPGHLFIGFTHSPYNITSNLDIYPIYSMESYRIEYSHSVNNAKYTFTNEEGIYELPQVNMPGYTYMGWKYKDVIYKKIDLSKIYEDIFFELVIFENKKISIVTENEGLDNDIKTIIHLDAASNIAAADFIVKYDKNKLSVKSIKILSGVDETNSLIMTHNIYDQGEIKFSFINQEGLKEALDMIEIIFEAINKEEELTTLISIEGSGIVDKDFYPINLIYMNEEIKVFKFYTVKYFDYLGNLISTQMIRKSNDSIEPEIDTRMGYNFIGFSEETTNINKNLEIYPIYSAIEYKIIYSETPKNALTTYTILTDDYVIPGLEKEGHTFIGWKYNGEFVEKLNLSEILSDISLELVLEVNTYEITFEYDGIIETHQVVYGMPIIYPNLESELYAYLWDIDYKIMPAMNLYTKATYVIKEPEVDLKDHYNLIYGEELIIKPEIIAPYQGVEVAYYWINHLNEMMIKDEIIIKEVNESGIYKLVLNVQYGDENTTYVREFEVEVKPKIISISLEQNSFVYSGNEINLDYRVYDNFSKELVIIKPYSIIDSGNYLVEFELNELIKNNYVLDNNLIEVIVHKAEQSINLSDFSFEIGSYEIRLNADKAFAYSLNNVSFVAKEIIDNLVEFTTYQVHLKFIETNNYLESESILVTLTTTVDGIKLINEMNQINDIKLSDFDKLKDFNRRIVGVKDGSYEGAKARLDELIHLYNNLVLDINNEYKETRQNGFAYAYIGLSALTMLAAPIIWRRGRKQ